MRLSSLTVISVRVGLHTHVACAIQLVHVIKNLFTSARSISVSGTRPSVKDGIKTDRIGGNILIALLAETIHPLEDFFGSLRGGSTSTRFCPLSIEIR
jgi:hypothetical protein